VADLQITCKQDGKIVVDKIEDEYRFSWDDDDLI